MTFPSAVLLATDFQEISERAQLAATELAKSAGARVVVMHAYQVPVFGFMDGAYVPSAAELEKPLAASRDALSDIGAKIEAEGVPVEVVLRDGEAAQAILDTLKERGCDLIVVGSHGRGLLARALLGSVAQRVLRHADVPVLVVRGTEE